MFKNSRRKIVAAIMSVLALLFLGTLAIIYASSYYEVSATNNEMLERYTQLYSLENRPGTGGLPGDGNKRPGKIPFDSDGPISDGEKHRFENTPAFQLSTFYSVAVSDSGEVLAVDNDGQTVYTDEQLETYAFEIVAEQRETGVKDSLLYRLAKKDGYTLIAFMDNTIMQGNMTTLFRHTLIFGSIAMVALFFVAVYLAKRIVKPLEESHQKQKQFISDAGHELKTPISVVSANAELLSREIGDNQWLANIQYENERMGSLVEQLLELARTEDTVPQMEHIDLSHLTNGEAMPFESVAFEKGLILNCQIEDGLLVFGNSGQLGQLISILLDNAIRHNDGGGEIVLRLAKERHFARLSVVNNGEEIPAEQQPQLFERFYRIDAARNGEEQHYGLGLAIAKAIVTAHKGEIGVLCYGGKVEFTVRFPLQK